MKCLIIYHQDTFACISGRIFSYKTQILPNGSVCVDEPSALFAIEKSQLNFDEIPQLISSQIEFIAFRQLITHLTIHEANQLTKAMQLIRWQQDHRFCSRCGSPTQPHSHEYAMICLNCHYHQYPRVQPCTINAIIKYIHHRPHLLLAHHRRFQDNPMYGLIAGFVEVGESLETCVHREILEETGLTVTNLRYFSSQPWAFPSNLMIGFIADYANGELIIDEHELTHADFFALDNLPKTPPKGTIAHQLIEFVKSMFT